MPARSYSAQTVYRYGFNGKEKDNSTGDGNLDFGARIYDGRIGRWLSVDAYAKLYPFNSPYVFVNNTPLQAIDPDGNLVVYCNGLLFEKSVKHWRNRVKSVKNDGSYGDKLGDDANFQNKEGIYKHKSLDGNSPSGYWEGTTDENKVSIKDELNDKFNDHNNVFANGTNRWYSGKVRYNEGKLAAETLIKQIEAGEVELKAGETIKIVGHSQGAMYAAGLAQGLIDGGYGKRLEQIVYLAPHQPTKIVTPEGVPATQLSRKTDAISSKGFIPKFISRSHFGMIKGLNKRLFFILDNIKSGFGINKFIKKSGKRGHDVEMYRKEFTNPVNTNKEKTNSGG